MCFITGKKAQEASVLKPTFTGGVPVCLLTAANRLSRRARQPAHDPLSTRACRALCSSPPLLPKSYRASAVSKTQAELLQPGHHKSSWPHFGRGLLYKFALRLGSPRMSAFHARRQAAVKGTAAASSLQREPDTAACILINDKLLFDRNAYFTHSLIYVHKKRLKLVNPRHLHLQPISKIPVHFWRSQYFIVDWKNLCKREK